MSEGLASTTLPKTPIVRNTDRLRAHLTKEGLAAALLSAWQHGEPAEGKARMLAALKTFYDPKLSGDDAIANPPD
jgi:hypothetical protein